MSGVDGHARAMRVVDALRAAGHTLAVAESCTGGGLARAITSVAGASDVFWGGAVVYANAAKTELCGVNADLIVRHGAVSERVAQALAEGIRARSGATWGLSVTGVAGPGGASAEKPVGSVWIALAGPRSGARKHRLGGGREQVREGATAAALATLAEALEESHG